ncbi:ribonuclease P protein component [Blattabacterium cuenoti]|uniref:ribonuclease P protein component n=1 Tax=Blattabacterium cuenoti TaxID=1653831 RepID=UPI00163BEDF9|nr:ribonuclease P protein component [Blattabacterium cuenoti]
MGFPSKKSNIIFNTIKNGKLFVFFPISIFFFLYPNEKKDKKWTNFIGILIKKKFKKAVDRNRIKRLLKASFFLNKDLLKKYKFYYHIVFIYQSPFLPKFKNINSIVKNIFCKIGKKKSKNFSF